MDNSKKKQVKEVSKAREVLQKETEKLIIANIGKVNFLSNGVVVIWDKDKKEYIIITSDRAREIIKEQKLI